MSAVLQWLHDAFVWLSNLPEYVIHKVWAELLEWGALVINALCPASVASWLASLGGIAGLGDGFGFWAEFFRLGMGVSIVCAAYAARFIVRRVPVFG